MSGDVEMLLLQLLLNSLFVIADSLSEGPMLIMKGREKGRTTKDEIRPGIYQTINCTHDRLQAPVPFPVREFR